jgi:hypothetical protein
MKTQSKTLKRLNADNLKRTPAFEVLFSACHHFSISAFAFVSLSVFQDFSF